MTPDERLRAEFEEWNDGLYGSCSWTLSYTKARYAGYRAAAEKRDGRYAGLVEAARGWMAVKWTVVNEEDGPVSMSLDEWARLRADLRTALAAPPEEE